MAAIQGLPEFEQITQFRESLTPNIEGLVQWATENHTASAIAVAIALAIIIPVYLFLSRWYEDRYGPEADKVSCRRVFIWSAILFVALARPPRKATQTWKFLGSRYGAEFAVVLSGTGTGKSMRILIQHLVLTLREKSKSIIVVDPKQELYAFARVFLGLLGGTPLVSRLSTDPKVPDEKVAAVDVFSDHSTAETYLQSVYASRISKDAIWEESAIDMVLKVRTALGGADLVRVYDTINNTEALDELAASDPEVAGVWAGSELKGSHHDARKNFLGPFHGLQEPQIRRLFDRERMGDAPEPGRFTGREALFLSFRQSDHKKSAPLISGLAGLLQTRAAEREEGPPVEILADEAGTSYPVALVDDFIKMCRGAGVNIALFFQDYAQLEGKVGNLAADSMIGGCELLIIGWTRSEETKALAESQSGMCWVTRKSPDGSKRELERSRIMRERPEKLGKGEFYVFHRGQQWPSKVTHKPVWPQYKRVLEPNESKQGEIRLNTPSPKQSRAEEQHLQERSSQRQKAMTPRKKAMTPHRECGSRNEDRPAANSGEENGANQHQSGAAPRWGPATQERPEDSAQHQQPTSSTSRKTCSQCWQGAPEWADYCPVCGERL